MSSMQKPLVLLGAGGHAKVVHALAEAAGRRIVGVCDPALVEAGVIAWRGIPVLGGDDALEGMNTADVELINGIGQLVGSPLRRTVFQRAKRLGFHFPPLVHPFAWVAGQVLLGEGVHVMAGAVVQPDCVIGENSVINTRAAVDHDCVVRAHVHIAPGATLCGAVIVGEDAFVGAGCTVIQGISIGRRGIVGAGAVVVKDLGDGCIVRPCSSSMTTRSRAALDDQV